MGEGSASVGVRGGAGGGFRHRAILAFTRGGRGGGVRNVLGFNCCTYNISFSLKLDIVEML